MGDLAMRIPRYREGAYMGGVALANVRRNDYSGVAEQMSFCQVVCVGRLVRDPESKQVGGHTVVKGCFFVRLNGV